VVGFVELNDENERPESLVGYYSKSIGLGKGLTLCVSLKAIIVPTLQQLCDKPRVTKVLPFVCH